MRSLVVVLSLLVATTVADARPARKTRRAIEHEHHARRPRTARAKHRVAIQGPIRGQSIGAPWQGVLRSAARLPEGEGYVIRRPWRAFGTRTTVDLIEQVIADWREQFPDAHVLAIGDLSAEHGGAITEHHSHQSGRDADIGLIYNEQPKAYPASFVTATEDNLDCDATFHLLEGFAHTASHDGGAQVIFLDFRVQGLLYRWAKDNGVDEDELDRLFQYPHGRGSSLGLVHHEPNHDNHMHVRFRCPRGDTACR